MRTFGGDAPPTSPPTPKRLGPQPERLAVAFARLLRRVGLEVPAGATVTYAEALAFVGLGDRDRVYWAGRATLVRRPEDVAAYDRAFGAFWLGVPGGMAIPAEPEPLTLLVDAEDEAPEEGTGAEPEVDEEGPVLRLRYSRQEVLRTKDFAACTPQELAELDRLMANLRLATPTCRTRRRRPAGRRGRHPDLRRTVRHALRTEGEPLRRAWLEPGHRPRRLVLLCDISGSMEPYARALVRFAHLVVTAGGRVEVFTIGTRLTRITRELSLHDPDAALGRAARAVPDWSGGTRLGETLRQFNDQWGIRGLARGAVVVVLSDGWDRGDPAVLGTEMARLGRVAHRIVWVNPLKASPGYAPLARGIAAALPHVDQFVEGHSLASLEALAEVVRTA